MTEITGTTRIYYMMAHPIDHVTTPEAMNPMFEARGIDAVMIPMHVHPDNLAQAWETFRYTRNLDGIVVSVPIKQRVLELCDEAHERAVQLGAANCVRRGRDGRMMGDNFDGAGFMAGMAKHGYGFKGERVLLAGAGGAGTALAFAIAGEHPAAITLSDRDRSRAEALGARVRSAYPECEVRVSDAPASPLGDSIAINATDSGLHEGDPLPLDAQALEAGTIVCDIIMKPRETALLRIAGERKCRLHHGRNMLDGQMELFWSFFGLPD